jgi:hypothetical protein
MLGMMPQKKKMASTILDDIENGEMKKKPDIQVDADMGLEAAAQDCISAVEKKDPKALVSAMRNLFSMLESENEMAEGPEGILNGDIG